MAFLLILCGTIAALVGTWRSYALAREAIGPLVHPATGGDREGGAGERGVAEGDPTRAAIDAARPLLLRTRVRRAIAAVGGSVVWLVIAMYGMFLIVRASELPPG